MTYLVMECHMAYAIVMDNEGRFLKVANLNYQVGQTLTQVFELEEQAMAPSVIESESKSANERKTLSKRFIRNLATIAACVCLFIFTSWQFVLTPYGTVRIQINPDVQITVNRLNYVINLEGINDDGRDLISGYDYKHKPINQVTSELSKKASSMGYLKNGGSIKFSLSSKSAKWKKATEQELEMDFEDYLEDSIQIEFYDSDDDDGYYENESESSDDDCGFEDDTDEDGTDEDDDVAILNLKKLSK